MKAISGLGRISAYLMLVYLAVKFVEILASGEGTLLLQAGWDTFNFWVEIVLGCAIPVFFLFRKRYRESTTAVFWVSLCAIIGMSLNRVNVAGLATLSLTNAVYIPAWTEWVMTFGILAAAALFYLVCVEYLGIFDGLGRDRPHDWLSPGRFDHTDGKALFFGGQRLGSLQMYSLVFVLAAALSFGFASDNAVSGVSPEKTPVKNPRWVEKSNLAGELLPANTPDETPPKVVNTHVMMLDGNRNDRFVLFDHESHKARNEGEKSCVLCHHMNKPYDVNTGCYECHSDMYLAMDIFDHKLHEQKLGGNQQCVQCHADERVDKTRESAKDCLECHKTMVVQGSRVKAGSPVLGSLAAGYMDALHGLCVECHKDVDRSRIAASDSLSSCTYCHQSFPHLTEELRKPGL